MWDIKLLLFSIFFQFEYYLYQISIWIFEFYDVYFYNGFLKYNNNIIYLITQNMVIFFGIKFVLAICLLILVRGGTPRYRYDYLTKLGWLKFLGFVLIIFFYSLLFYFIF